MILFLHDTFKGAIKAPFFDFYKKICYNIYKEMKIWTKNNN